MGEGGVYAAKIAGEKKLLKGLMEVNVSSDRAETFQL
jgi:hypothetical protein